MNDLPLLPVTEIFPALDQALATKNGAVLVAPPGAGKTTLIPLHLLQADWRGDGTIVLLEPRRLAARAAARRMAGLLGEDVGATVGYRMRLDSKVSAQSRIIVVTEGVFARMVLDDPMLAGIAAVLFDEFHERSLDADFGLALALDVQGALRPDLKLLVMSATLDGARVARLLGDAPVLESEGRSYPIDIRHRERRPEERIEAAMAKAIRDMVHAEPGSILAFLPGQREIERTAQLLADDLPADCFIVPLYGALEAAMQDAAIKPAPPGKRKIVLATSIAETSITIDGVRIVIDSGLARLPRFEAATGLTRLETVRASRAAVDQRAGRAGRTEPGIALRLWRAEQTAALETFTTPEILQADLTGLLLDCAAWGLADPADLRFLDAPPRPALNEARLLLNELGALEDERLTPVGKAMRGLALPARLAHMVLLARERGEALQAAELAVLVTERGLGGNDADLDARLANFRRDRGERARAARALAQRLAGPGANKAAAMVHAGRLLLDAYPDRVAKSRGNGQFTLANGRGGEVDAISPLARAAFLVVADMAGRAGRARILAAAEVSEADIAEALAGKIVTARQTAYDSTRNALSTRETVRIGALVLAERTLPAPGGDEANLGVIEAIRAHGLDILPWPKEASILRRRLAWLHSGLGAPWPAMSDEALLQTLEDWLLPFLGGTPRLNDIGAAAITNGLRSLVPHELQRRIDTLAPTHFTVPTGSNTPIRYEEGEPVLSVRVQELYGLATHPAIANGTVPLLLELLSPAHRPIQITRDLPGFWKGSWSDVRSEMRGRYPRHVWPDDPATAVATSRAKPRGS
ncbi:ATP-dependent helicase HrpB [Phyllobacterium sp. 0TCS1.6C]|uniref:ATP-dependent helicase HrpB n=1 Tax=unclassified Phyllobacterium TaxID=2638441 RepID=UPI002263C767|nr:MULTISPECIES: ATP-dependent helicase HrpB [unclassified Phyllobacterium]MCX8282412.1 ATP-dependent helicase HrpB [Phyllobacterium sp. 0TCS1.6C]MCX8295235.1 ATP-dependent helicase HrpB [Phyllobacterium sp. 0TCS1.6A]